MNAKQDSVRVNNPPYISSNIWQAFFEKMQRVNRPSILSVDLLRQYGIPAAQSELLSALKFLGLTDNESKTTEKFVGIQLKGEAFKVNLKDILLESYSDLFEKHPLEHASYDDLQNYFAIKYSQASAKKMAKSFAVLCQLAGLHSEAFSKMRASESMPRPSRHDPQDKSVGITRETKRERSAPRVVSPNEATREDLIREFIKTNPMPTGVQWDASTLKEYFEQYRETLRMLRNVDDQPEN